MRSCAPLSFFGSTFPRVASLKTHASRGICDCGDAYCISNPGGESMTIQELLVSALAIWLSAALELGRSQPKPSHSPSTASTPPTLTLPCFQQPDRLLRY